MPTYLPTHRGVSVSEALAEAYSSAPADVVVIHTLDFIHPSFTSDAGHPTGGRIVKSQDSLYARIEPDAEIDGGAWVLFAAVDFDFVLPTESDSSSVPEIQIKVDNVSKYLIPYLDAASESLEPVTVIYRPYLSTDYSQPHIMPPLKMTITSFSADVFSVTAKASFSNLANRRFPYMRYTAKMFPGLSAR